MRVQKRRSARPRKAERSETTAPLTYIIAEALEVTGNSSVNDTAKGKHLFDCPVCDGKGTLDVTWRPTIRRLPFIGCFPCTAHGLAGGDYLRELAPLVGAPGGGALLADPLRYLGEAVAQTATDRPPAKLPSDASLAGWQSRLFSDDVALDYLKDERGLTEDTIREYELGYDGRAIVMPIRGQHGDLVNVRRRFLAPGAEQPKYMGLRGRPGQLYPCAPDGDKELVFILCAGEFDALVTRQHGVEAVSGTIGTAWRAEWNAQVAGRRIAVVFDASEYEVAKKRARMLRREAECDAWPVDLQKKGLSGNEDLTDWFLGYRLSGHALIKHALTARGRQVRAARRRKAA